MKIRSVNFEKGVVSHSALPKDGTFEVAFAGRSNVGKSSVMNSLLGRSKVAKVSKTPGRTREVNFFKINESFYFVDLPGYGYAKASGYSRAIWAPLILKYLEEREELKAVVLILDVRRKPNDEDLTLVDFLREVGATTVVVVNKCDKLPLQQRQKQIKIIADHLHLQAHDLVQFSVSKGQGRDSLWKTLELLLTPEK